MHRETLCVNGLALPARETRPVAGPICQSVAFEFDDAAQAAALFSLEREGDRYARVSNPTNTALEQKLAAIEGAKDALVLASGQAALHCAVLGALPPGGELVSSPALYGATHTLFAQILPQAGYRVRFARAPDAASMAACMSAETAAVFCETFANPGGAIADIAPIAQAAHAHGAPLIVDNTFATPALVQPMRHGADIVVYSLTKFMGGHGVALGGAILDAERFDWGASGARHAHLTTPDPCAGGLVFATRFGAGAYLARCRNSYLRVTGAALAPFSAFLLQLGLETLGLRMARHVENARQAAEFLARAPEIAWVSHGALADAAEQARLARYAGGQACPVFTVGFRGGAEAAREFYDALRLIKRAVNVGDARSLACHPASTTHRQMSEAAMRAAGVLPEAVRLSIGLEHIDDIMADLAQALQPLRHANPGLHSLAAE